MNYIVYRTTHIHLSEMRRTYAFPSSLRSYLPDDSNICLEVGFSDTDSVVLYRFVLRVSTFHTGCRIGIFQTFCRGMY